MSSFVCIAWWVLLGSLLGWLASWLLGRRPPLGLIERAAPPRDAVPNSQEKFMDQPIDRTVDSLVLDVQAVEAHNARPPNSRRRDDKAETAEISGNVPTSVDDLEVNVEARLKTARLLQKDGAETNTERPHTSQERIRSILNRGGTNAMIAESDAQPDRTDLVKGGRQPQFTTMTESRAGDAHTDQPSEQRDIQTQSPAQDVDSTRRFETAVVDFAAAREAGFNPKCANDFEIIEGVKPKIVELLHANGVRTFTQLADMSPADIQPMLDKAGPSFCMTQSDSWPEQAALAAHNNWRALRFLQQSMTSGVR